MFLIENYVSQNGIRFLTSQALCDVISEIETTYAGWWWSLSQSKNDITLSLGPGQNCPDPRDVAFAQTKIGDEGFVCSFGSTDKNISQGFLDLMSAVLEATINDKLSKTNPLPLPINTRPYRHQHIRDLAALTTGYAAFLQDLTFIEKHGHILNELYLGSCDLSVDCSLRGHRGDGSEFDISIDLQGNDVNIAESLHHSAHELRNDVLTFG